ncbi:MAG: serine/threonine-protein phosphatase [Labilithrix sp.]|nr:serine/threonine-protein phosphatase [Labilithrix sp.]
MAVTDVIGILSLVLAAAGAAYLVWTRVLRVSPPGAAIPPEAGDPAAGAGDGRPVASGPRSGAPQAGAGAGEDRAAETPAPGLRPEAEISPRARPRQDVRATLPSAHPPPPASSSPPLSSPRSSVSSRPASSSPVASEVPTVDKELASKGSSSSAVGAAAVEVPTVDKELASKGSSSSAVGAAAVEAASLKSAVASTASGAAPSSSAVAAAKEAPAKVSSAATSPASSKRLARAEVAPSSSRHASALGASKETPVSREAKPATPARAPDVAAGRSRVDASASVRAVPAAKPARLPDPSAAPPIVEPSVLDEGADAEPAADAAPALAVHALGRTDPGKRRKDNEDSLLVFDKANVFAVADGMGEHGGQRASRLAVATIAEAFEHACFDAAPHAGVPRAASELARAIQMANAAIRHEAKEKPELAGMGSTLSAARLTAGARRLYIGHVGDSRCYRLREGVMKQLTTDYAASDHGVAGPEGTRPSRVLGAGPAVTVDVILAEPRAGDVYLLCTRGLTKMIPDGTIATQLLHEEDPEAALERLVFFANAHGGKENITAILLRVVAAPR